jgi:putative NADPH-quinone reductase
VARITLVLGHPDKDPRRYGRALAAAYAEGARAGGHELRIVDVADLDFPLLRSASDWKTGALPPALRQAQQDIFGAEHLAIFFPVWLGSLPALLKGFLEQVLRIDGPRTTPEGEPGYARPLRGKSVRIVATMGMPAFAFRWYYGGLGYFERGILRFCGAGTIDRSLIGNIEASAKNRERWLRRLRELGREGS